jgi:hypothetical protein
MKAGSKLESTACDTQVMVIRNTQEEAVIECGGAAMVAAPAPGDKVEPTADHTSGTLMGKRYVDEDGTIELLCIKAGKGSLALNGVPLGIKDAKPLPSSD